MNLILTMAGKYSRFLNEGFKIPKFLLPWGNKSILSEILTQLLCDGDFKQVFLVVKPEDHVYFGHIKAVMVAHGIPIKNLIVIDQQSQGQAHTAFLGVEKICASGPIVFHNIDTILYHRNTSDIGAKLKNYAGYIDVFNSSSFEYSYVSLTDELVSNIIEKNVISDMATSGLYGFASIEKFLQYYDQDIYISEVYKKMIINHEKITIGNLYTQQETVVLGTPSEYLINSASFKF